MFIICQQLNIPLAPPHKEDKHFGPTTKGTIQGIEFDTVSLEWSLPKDRKERLLADLNEVVEGESSSLTQLRSLVGKINAQFLPSRAIFLKLIKTYR